MTLSCLRRALRDILASALDPREADATARIILEDGGGFSPVAIAADGDRTLEDFTVERLTGMARRVADGGEPVQYVVGVARFYGMDLHVTPDVLIPRPETEGLVDRVVDAARGRSDLRVLDVCTGSGCIAIALARTLPFADVEACDISAAALDVARRNAADTGAKVTFFEADAMNMPAPASPRYDIVVSNPPYIARSEAELMDDRVLLHEPSLARFVPDDDPLRVYRAVAVYAQSALVPGGRLFFEINSLYADATADLLRELGYTDVELDRDMYRRMRYASATLPQR